ncbi:MAG: AAA family ATPase [Armatimonadetes bacterium]|nr:AAA family ATPase [Armatimonadota bacterium]
MNRTLINFLNHGLLPFTGREAELERLLNFWRETFQAHGLRTMMVVGEAGVGKSRLTEEAASQISIAGGVVMQARFYPDAATSIPSLLARAVSRNPAAQQLLKSDPEETLSGVTSAILRICGLRPTLLVLEDVHLLGGDVLGEFAPLLERLADEPLSILLTARPVTLAARGLIERFLVDEIVLTGINESDIATICTEIFGNHALDEAAIRALSEKTLGNAMAIRSALRGAVRPTQAGNRAAAAASTASGMIDARAFTDSLERNVRLLSEGMVAHLTESEKSAAATVAMLGEVFARETAALLLPDAAAAINPLIFKGVLSVPTATPSSLAEYRAIGTPLTFTHNLIHRHFVESRTHDPNMIVQLLAEQRTLYSILPLELLGKQLGSITATPETVLQAIRGILTIAFVIDGTRMWRSSLAIWSIGAEMATRVRPQLEEPAQRELDVMLIRYRLQLLRREQAPEYTELVEQLLELTANPINETWGEYRLAGLIFQRRLLRRKHPEQLEQQWGEVEQVVEQFPALRRHIRYAGNLIDLGRAASSLRNLQLMRMVERKLNELQNDPSIPADIVRSAFVGISPNLLWLYQTEEELQRRLQSIQELEELTKEGRKSDLRIQKIGLYHEIGLLDEMLANAQRSLPRFRELGLRPEVMSCQLVMLNANAMLGADFGALAQQAEEVCASNTNVLKVLGHQLIGSILMRTALLRCDQQKARQLREQFGIRTQDLTATLGYLLENETINETEDSTASLREPLNLLARLQQLVQQGGALQEVERVVGEIFRCPILAIEDLAATHAVFRLVGSMPQEFKSLPETLRRHLHDGLERAVEHLERLRLPALIAPLLKEFGYAFSKGELTARRARLKALQRERESEQLASNESAETRTKVMMFGTITVQRPGEEPERVRGAQIATLLGLMTANEMLARRLSHREFMALAIGNERDPDKARKSLNFAVFRLREAIGSEAVDTIGEVPQLNREAVWVDLLEADQQLKEAIRALKEGGLLRAVPAIAAAMRIGCGQVPFPTLYDEFFESAREDYENTLRETLLRVAKLLTKEGDLPTAEELLEQAFAAMPDDEEIAELFREVLLRQGKRTEATRVEMKLAQQEEE